MARPYFLTKRQEEILDRLKTTSVKILARELGISPSTIYSIKDNVKAKIKESERVKREYRNILYPRRRRRR